MAVWWKNRTEYSKPYICWIWVILNVLIVLVLLRGNWDEATGPTSKKCSKLCGNGVEIWGRRIWRSFTTTPSQLHDSEVEYSHHTAWRLLLLLRLHVQKKLSKFNRAKMPIIMIIRFMRYLHQTVEPSQTYQKPVFTCYILLFLLGYMNSAFKCILSHAKTITELF